MSAATVVAADRLRGFAAAPDGLLVRPAASTDAPAVARLFVDLYRDELPGLLVGGEDGTAAFLERHLLAGSGARLAGLHVGERDGGVVALAGLNTAGDPRPPVSRPFMVRDLLACIGNRGTVRLAVPLVRNALSRVAEDDMDAGYIHSVVVAGQVRGRGIGAQLVAALELQALAYGCTSTLVQVMDDNAALGFWEARGYETERRLPAGRVARVAGLGSTLLRRRLTA